MNKPHHTIFLRYASGHAYTAYVNQIQFQRLRDLGMLVASSHDAAEWEPAPEVYLTARDRNLDTNDIIQAVTGMYLTMARYHTNMAPMPRGKDAPVTTREERLDARLLSINLQIDAIREDLVKKA